MAGDEAAEFARVGGGSVVVIGEQVSCDRGADAGADVGCDGGLRVVVVRDVVVGVGDAQPTGERVLGGVDAKRAAEPGGGQRAGLRDARIR